MIISDQRNEKVESAEMKLKEYQKEKDHENH